MKGQRTRRLNGCRTWALAVLGVGALLVAAAPGVCAEGAPRPNIVFFLADDLGFEALGCYGAESYKGLGPVRTPNLDSLAKSGMLFTQCFSCPVCSPARSEFLTGKYNFRTGFRRIMGQPGVAEKLDAAAHPTVANRLKDAGYVTAVVGKWHVGQPFTKANQVEEVPQSDERDTDYPHPRECGFERQCLFSGGHLSTYGEPKPGQYTPELLQKWALRFLESRKGKPEPFFLYYASPIPHEPLYPTPLNPDGKSNGRRGDASNYPYLIEYMDRQVGELVEKLAALGLRENTLVMFSGDNGSHPTKTTLMRDGREIKGGKGSPADTGAWVPLIASWPAAVRAGSTYAGPVDFTDLLPTCLELAGGARPQGIDGMSFAPQLCGRPGAPREWVFVLGGDRWYVRDARWKLRNSGELLDVSGSPAAEKPVPSEGGTSESKAARERLQAALDRLNPGKQGIQEPTP